MEKKNIVFYGNGPLLNRGCEAILRSSIDMLSRGNQNISFTSAPYFTDGIDQDQFQLKLNNLDHIEPKPLRKKYSLPWLLDKVIPKLKVRRSISFKSKFDELAACIIVGGDNLSLDYGVWLPQSQFDVINYLCDSNIDTFIIGASIGPFAKHQKIESYAKRTLNRVTQIYARETLTMKYLEDIGIRGNVTWAPDPAFNLQKTRPILEEKLEKILAGECIGINLSPLFAKKYGGDVRVWVDFAFEMIQELQRKINVPILLIPHVFNSKSNDQEFLKTLYMRLSESGVGVHMLYDNFNACELKWIISNVNMFIGARTHSTVAALSQFVPTISLGYSVKAEGINKDIFGSDEWVISLSELSVKTLANKAVDLWNQRDIVRAKLEEVMIGYKKSSLDVGDDIIKHISKSSRG